MLFFFAVVFFLAVDFFLAAAFFLLAAVLFVDFLVVFLAVDDFGADFLAVVFLAVVDLDAVDFFAVDFLAVDFLAVDVLDVELSSTKVDFLALDFFDDVDFVALDLPDFARQNDFTLTPLLRVCAFTYEHDELASHDVLDLPLQTDAAFAGIAIVKAKTAVKDKALAAFVKENSLDIETS